MPNFVNLTKKRWDKTKDDYSGWKHADRILYEKIQDHTSDKDKISFKIALLARYYRLQFEKRHSEKTIADVVITALRDIKKVAIRYKAVTGRPFGVTGEVGEFEAARALKGC